MKDNETLILLSEDEDEWYQQYYICSNCGCSFMIDNKPGFCPCCGKKIIGIKQEGITIYE